MNGIDSFSDMPTWLLVTALIAVAVLVLLMVRRAAHHGRADQSHTRGEQQTKPLGLITPDAGAAVQELPDVEARAVPSQPPRRDGKTIAKDIVAAEAANQESELAALYLEQAQVDLFAGNTDAAAVQLRKSIMLATTLDQKAIHAAARLELADLSKADGDLTTACEHWQMARGLFHALDQKVEMDKTDARMLRNGCPTDWVLTDF